MIMNVEIVINSTVFFSVLVCIVLYVVRYIKSQYTVFSELGIPGPRPTFLFGNSLDFANKFPMDVFKAWSARYGHVYGFYEGLRPSVVVSCPDMAHQILVKHFNIFSSRPTINPFKYESQGLSLQHVSGALWKRQRQAVSAGLTTKSIKQMYPVMCDVTSQLIKHLQTSTENSPDGFYIDDLIERYSLDWFAQAALGYHSDALTNGNSIQLRFMRASHESMSPSNAITGLAKLFPSMTPLLKPLDKTHKELSSLQTSEIKHFLRTLMTNWTKRPGEHCQNILYNLLTRKVAKADADVPTDTRDGETPHGSRSRLCEDEVVGEVAGLIGGGVGPVSATLTFCIYNMAVYEEEQMRLREELESVTRCKDNVTLEELGRLDYMERFILETLRLFPVAPGVSRECLEDCSILGVQFKKGMVVRVLASTMHTREDLFPDHKDFRPHRFIPGASSNRDKAYSGTSHPRGYLPFGLGPRMCVGQRLAMVSLKLALARLLQEYDVTISHMTQIPVQVELRPFIVAKNGVHIKLLTRPNSSSPCRSRAPH
uniref:Cytochrome P450 n=1 Tax=Biomphalaria glabrata TaxID=6526 RepID=A0A2C9L247_BIOGL